MIGLQLYRSRIGGYCRSKGKYQQGIFSPQQYFFLKGQRDSFEDTSNSLGNFFNDDSNTTHNVLYLLYLYFIFVVCAVIMSTILSLNTITPSTPCTEIYFQYHAMTGNAVLMLYVKCFYCIIFSYANKSIQTKKHVRDNIFYKLLIRPSTSIHHGQQLDRLNKAIQSLFLWLCIINFLLIAIVNPSLLNPGPTSTKNPIPFTVHYQNVQGLIPFGQLNEKHPTLNTTKINEIGLYLQKNNPDVIVLNETWLKSSILDDEVIPTDKYEIFRLDRSSSTHPPDPNNIKKYRQSGGGVLIGVRRNIGITCKEISVKCKAEILSVKLTENSGKKTILSSFYRVGTLGAENHSRVEKYITKIRQRRNVTGIFIIGDMNFPKVNWADFVSMEPTEQLFLNTFGNLSLEQLVDKPTHIKGNILDYVITDKADLITNLSVDSQNLICGSDHYLIKFNLSLNKVKKKPAKRSIYNFKNAHWDDMNYDFSSVNWHSLLASNNIEESLTKFKTKFFTICNKHIPKMKISNDFKPPWYDSEVFELDRKKHRLHTKSKKSSSDLHHAKFAACKKELNELIKKKMDANFQDENNRNFITKKLHSYVKSKSNSHRIPELVSYGSKLKSKRLDQCNLFNQYFFDQFSEPSLYNIPIDYSSDHQFSINFDTDHIASLLKNLDPNKTQGPDGIHGKILKNCYSSLSKPLAILFQLSYNTGNIPGEWKQANVVPVHKKGSKACVENYRPISLTSIIMKTYERIIREKLLNMCGHLIDDRQHGFMLQKSCCTQLVTFCDSLSLSLNKNIQTNVIYFDFQKAFDSVNHDIILKKLKSQYKIDGSLLRFFVNYLKGRNQQVVICGEKSSNKIVTSGVPQGSIIGPTLFLLFINDITLQITPGTNIALYADDTKIWREIITGDDHWILQNDINKLLNWARVNKIKFHPDKSKVLTVTNANDPENLFIYTLESKIIEYTPCEKDLGIKMVPNLTWTEHTNFLYSRANQRLGMLKRNCNFVSNLRKRRALYLTQVRSQFEHCPIIWRPSSKTSMEKLESIQKRGFKWILQMYTGFSSKIFYYHTCKQLDILPISTRFDLKDLTYFHSIFYGFSKVKFPSYLSRFQGSSLRKCHLDKLCMQSSIHPKVPQNLEIEIPTTGISNSFFYRTHSAWNRLPFKIRSIESQTLFKSAITKHLWLEAFAVASLPSNLLDDLDE